MLRFAFVLAGAALMTACASSAPPPSPAARGDLAPTGKLRAGVNYGNFILAQKDPATGDSRGPAIDLARELGKRLGVPVELEATYLVPPNSRLRTIADVDQEGVRVAAPTRANYELYLSRNLKRANLVRADNADAAFRLLVEGRVEALAGFFYDVAAPTEKLPGSRMIDGRFMAVPQS